MTKQERTERQLRNQTVTMAKQIAILQKHNDRLNEELPEMRKENQRLTGFLQDASAYLRYCSINSKANFITLGTLAHDINGLANDEPCFMPRVSGYAEREKVNSSKLL